MIVFHGCQGLSQVDFLGHTMSPTVRNVVAIPSNIFLYLKKNVWEITNIKNDCFVIHVNTDKYM